MNVILLLPLPLEGVDMPLRSINIILKWIFSIWTVSELFACNS